MSGNFTPADVSAVVCTMNSISSIEECLSSLREAGTGEVIVVDARSTDGTREVVMRLADQVLEDAGGGLGNARNIGIMRTTKPLVLIVGSDNVMPPGTIETMIASMEMDSAQGVGARTRIRGSDYLSRSLNTWRRARFRPGPAEIVGSPTLFNGELIREFPFDSTRRFSDDTELCQRWARDHKAIFVIADAPVDEIGRDSWTELLERSRMYGTSDYEVFTHGRDSGWSFARKAKSLAHPIQADFAQPLLRLDPATALVTAPFLAAFTAMRYLAWARSAIN